MCDFKAQTTTDRNKREYPLCSKFGPKVWEVNYRILEQERKKKKEEEGIVERIIWMIIQTIRGKLFMLATKEKGKSDLWSLRSRTIRFK